MSALGWAKAYCLAVAIAVAAWWALLLLLPGVRPAFLGPDLPFEALLAFLPGDLIVMIAAPLAFARTGRRVWFELFCFGTAYACLAASGLCAMSKGGWGGAIAMAFAFFCAYWIRRELWAHEAS